MIPEKRDLNEVRSVTAPAYSLENFPSTAWGWGDQAEPDDLSYLRKDEGGPGSHNLCVLRAEYTEERATERQEERRVQRSAKDSLQVLS